MDYKFMCYLIAAFYAVSAFVFYIVHTIPAKDRSIILRIYPWLLFSLTTALAVLTAYTYYVG